jgi:hypothetical protein
MKRIVNPSVPITDRPLCEGMTEIAKARRHQAITSSIEAQVRDSIPTFVPSIFFSARSRASTGKAVIDIAVPTRRINESCVAFVPAKFGYKKYPRRDPKMSGRIIPLNDTKIALRL